MATNAPLPDAPTLREILRWALSLEPENVGRPKGQSQTYMGLPVDMSNLDQPITGYVVQKFNPKRDDNE